DGEHLLRGEPADRRAAAGRFRGRCTERHRRPGAGLHSRPPAAAGCGRKLGEPARSAAAPARAYRCEGGIMAALLEVADVGKRFGGFVALDGINLSVAQGERVGLIGPNGSGKSTLVNCICGTLTNETGSVTFGGKAMDGLTAHQRTHLGM